jgi:hypothetical protein
MVVEEDSPFDYRGHLVVWPRGTRVLMKVDDSLPCVINEKEEQEVEAIVESILGN